MYQQIDDWIESQTKNLYIVMVYSVKHESLAKNGILTERQIEKVVIIWRKIFLRGFNFLLRCHRLNLDA